MSEKILIVDDEEHICSILSSYLQGEGFAVFESNDLAGARQHLKNGLHPDLMVLDVMLPDGNGTDLVKEMRQQSEWKDIPVIMMSAHRIKSRDKVLGLEVGADDYITKPFDLRELHLRIEKILKSRRTGIPVESQIGLTEPAPEDDISQVLKGVLQKKVKPSVPLPAKGPETKNPKPEPVHLSAVVNKYLELILEPFNFFTDSSPAQFFWSGLGCLVVSGIFEGLQEGFESKSVSVGFVSLLLAPLIQSSIVALAAWLIQWTLGLKQKSFLFKPIFSALAIGFAPVVLSAFLGVLYVSLAGGAAGDFTAGPLLLMPSQASSKYLGFFLQRLDVFELWGLLLSMVALWKVLGGPKKKVFLMTLLVWFLVVGAVSLLKGYFS